MAPKTQNPEPEQAPRKEADAGSQAPEQEHRKETFTKEPLDGEPGYGEPPPEVRKDKLPDQGW